jgi:hypothetical protein
VEAAMAIVHDDESKATEGTGVILVVTIVLILLIVILFWGLAVQHWFGFDVPSSVNPAPSATPAPSASAAASASASP